MVHPCDTKCWVSSQSGQSTYDKMTLKVTCQCKDTGREKRTHGAVFEEG